MTYDVRQERGRDEEFPIVDRHLRDTPASYSQCSLLALTGSSTKRHKLSTRTIGEHARSTLRSPAKQRASSNRTTHTMTHAGSLIMDSHGNYREMSCHGERE